MKQVFFRSLVRATRLAERIELGRIAAAAEEEEEEEEEKGEEILRVGWFSCYWLACRRREKETEINLAKIPMEAVCLLRRIYCPGSR